MLSIGVYEVAYRFLSVLVFVFTALSAPLASAVTLDWDREELGGSVRNGEQVTNGGITLTFSNIVTADGSPRGDVDGDGIFFSTDNRFNDVVQLDLTFNRNVIWDEYDIDFEQTGANRWFQVAGSNGTSGLNTWGTTGRFDFDMGSIPVFLAGVNYTLTHNVPNNPNNNRYRFSQIDEIVVTAVPVPASGVLLGSAIGLGYLVRRRRLAAQ